MDRIIGNAFILNDNVDTDQILPGYAMSYPVEKLKNVALKGSIIPNFSELVEDGDIIIAGENFGCGSSREQAPLALKNSGVGAIIAKSFSRIFRKNAINIGLPVITSDYIDDIKEDFMKGDRFEVDIMEATLLNIRTGQTCKLNRLSFTTLETLEAGGLINKVRKQLKERGAI